MKAKLLTTLILLFCFCSAYAAGAVDITSGNVINPSFENDDITKLTPKTESADGLRGYIQTQPVGWTYSGSALDKQLIITTLAEQLQDCGIQALTIHGRTRSQMYTGEADWTLIGEVKRNPRITIPIIGNGDIHSRAEAEEAFNRYGVDAVMIGRATFGCPWLFSNEELTFDQKLDVLLEQLRINVEMIDEQRGILHTRRHLAATPLLKGIKNFRDTRIAMLRASTKAELTEILDYIENEIFPTLDSVS